MFSTHLLTSATLIVPAPAPTLPQWPSLYNFIIKNIAKSRAKLFNKKHNLLNTYFNFKSEKRHILTNLCHEVTNFLINWYLYFGSAGSLINVQILKICFLSNKWIQAAQLYQVNSFNYFGNLNNHHEQLIILSTTLLWS